MACQGPARVRSLSGQHPQGRELEQNLCSKSELDSQDLTGKEGGLATASRDFIADDSSLHQSRGVPSLRKSLEK